MLKTLHLTRCMTLPIILAATWTTPAPGQVDLPEYAINSKADLLAAVKMVAWETRNLPGYDGIVRQALLAMQGDHLRVWLIDIATDPTVPSVHKAGAFSVMRLMRDPDLVDWLLDLASPGSGENPLRGLARNALTAYPYPQVCEFWRGFLRTSTDFDALLFAAIGLGYCGNPQDTTLLHQMLARMGNKNRLQLLFPVQMTDSAIVKRSRGRTNPFPIFDARRGPRQDGRYEPTDSVAAAIRRTACVGSCRGVVLAPNEQFRGLRRRPNER